MLVIVVDGSRNGSQKWMEWRSILVKVVVGGGRSDNW